MGRKDEAGSAILIAVTALAMATLFMLASASLTARMSTNVTNSQEKDAVDKFTQFIEAIAANPETCIGTGPLSGLTFVDPTTGDTGKDHFTLLSPGAPAEQDVRLASNIEEPPGVLKILKGSDAADSSTPLFSAFNNLRLERFFIRNARRLDGSTYQVELLHKSVVGVRRFAPRMVGNLTLNFVSGSLNSCILKASAQAVCEDMGCKFNITATNQKCACGFPAMSCPQVDGEPLAYIAGIDTTHNPPKPVCRTFKVSCLTRKGPGFALSGISTDGQPICEAVEGHAATPNPNPTPTPTPSPSPSPTPTPTSTPVVPSVACYVGTKLKVRWGNYAEQQKSTNYYHDVLPHVYGGINYVSGGHGTVYAQSTVRSNGVEKVIRAECSFPPNFMDPYSHLKCTSAQVEDVGGTSYSVTVKYDEDPSSIDIEAQIYPDPGSPCL